MAEMKLKDYFGIDRPAASPKIDFPKSFDWSSGSPKVSEIDRGTNPKQELVYDDAVDILSRAASMVSNKPLSLGNLPRLLFEAEDEK